jgi:hypothetical protein
MCVYISWDVARKGVVMCVNIVDRTFDDKRIAVGVLMIWLAIVMTVFKDLGLLDSNFMNFGPSKDTKFMGVVLDSWYKWGMVATFTFVNTSINDFMSDAISPWILNTITDHKTKLIPYRKLTCLLISQSWSVYCNIMSVFGLFLAMSQVDFVLIRTVADLTVNTYTNTKFMRNKEYSPSKYYDIELQPIHDTSGPDEKQDDECGELPVFSIGDEEPMVKIPKKIARD